MTVYQTLLSACFKLFLLDFFFPLVIFYAHNFDLFTSETFYFSIELTSNISFFKVCAEASELRGLLIRKGGFADSRFLVRAHGQPNHDLCAQVAGLWPQQACAWLPLLSPMGWPRQTWPWPVDSPQHKQMGLCIQVDTR